MKKKIIILIANILLSAILLLFFDFLFFNKFYNEEFDSSASIKEKAAYYIKCYKQDYGVTSWQGLKYSYLNFRHLEDEEFFNNLSNHNSILLFGCSYANSSGLDTNETINYRLSKILGSKVYDFAFDAASTQHMLALLMEEDFYSLIQDEPKYAIYLYIPGHFERIMNSCYSSPISLNGQYIRYKLNGDTLTEYKTIIPNILTKTFIVKSIFYSMQKNKFSLEEKYEKFALFNEILLESRRLLQEKYPNIKFVILRYRTENDNEEINELPFMWEVLEMEGFIVLDTEALIGRKYKYHSKDTIDDGFHPSSYAWDLLLPKIVEKLNLKTN